MVKVDTISSLGEIGLISNIKQGLSNTVKDKNIVVDIGDDCFCFKLDKNYIYVTKDMLIENIHFRTDWTTPYEIGKKSVEVNISDIAAMGNVLPKYIFIGFGAPASTPKSFVTNLFKGIKETCNKYNMLLSGGDTVRSEKIIISVTVIGMSKSKPVKRGGAKVGDLIGVTGNFGDSGAGLYLLNHYGLKYDYTQKEQALVNAQNIPQAKINEASKMYKYLTSLTDASDGLFTSLNLITQSFSKCANIDIESIPISKNLKSVFSNKKQILNFALFGAEDYQLVFTVPRLKSKTVKNLVPNISYIGEVTSGKDVKYFYDGKEKKIKDCGFKHFSK